MPHSGPSLPNRGFACASTLTDVFSESCVVVQVQCLVRDTRGDVAVNLVDVGLRVLCSIGSSARPRAHLLSILNWPDQFRPEFNTLGFFECNSQGLAESPLQGIVIITFALSMKMLNTWNSSKLAMPMATVRALCATQQSPPSPSGSENVLF